MTVRFHVVFAERVSKFGDMIVNGVQIEDGFKGIFDYDGDDRDYIEECLDSDTNVVRYSSENL